MPLTSGIAAAMPEHAGDGGRGVLRVAYVGRPDVVARVVEAIVTADPWLRWVGREQDEERFHRLCSAAAPDVAVVAQAVDRDRRVLHALRNSVPHPAVVVLADEPAGPVSAGVAGV